ncbi:DUF4293 family protein [Pontibacter qinzhouensis]|uniref:DUF4293 family protein n=1 Tax=Pontibacter qinzhouensis TaxID=2603253 RepID=A0A5C8KBW6_9BACT|nr:DUF4293 domain-containing protein [Pontibacter qinzhouensis]TXK52906.1 DUF4293 family protein [Pontibacter qinzhouensis]
MIQRIQSVFLFLLVLAMVSLLFVDIWSKTDSTSGQTVVLTAFSIDTHFLNEQGEATNTGATQSQGAIAIGLLAIVAAVIALYEIFQFKNRLTQMKLGLFNTLVLVALFGTCFYQANYIANDMVMSDMSGIYEPGFYMPVLALLLNALANRFIKRDEDLVRSVDRLR